MATTCTKVGVYRLAKGKFDVLEERTQCGLAHDGKCNAILWAKRVEGKDLFKDYIPPLYALKKLVLCLTKHYLNIFTGALGQKIYTRGPISTATGLVAKKRTRGRRPGGGNSLFLFTFCDFSNYYAETQVLQGFVEFVPLTVLDSSDRSLVTPT